ncbi:uncharacterized protein DC041_0011104, partial [Schistosoma bovis]
MEFDFYTSADGMRNPWFSHFASWLRKIFCYVGENRRWEFQYSIHKSQYGLIQFLPSLLFNFVCISVLHSIQYSCECTYYYRIAAMLFFFTTQALMVWNFITFHQRHRRDKQQSHTSKSWFLTSQDSGQRKKEKRK